MNGIEKQIDDLGRVVLPIKMRKKLQLTSKSTLFIHMENDTIILTPKELRCALCNEKLIRSNEIRLCQDCIDKVKTL